LFEKSIHICQLCGAFLDLVIGIFSQVVGLLQLGGVLTKRRFGNCQGPVLNDFS